MANPITPSSSIGAAPVAGKSNRFGDSLMGQLAELLTKALANSTTLEVRTFTAEVSESSLAKTGDPLEANTRLRAFTRVAIDGDTETCIPLLANGEPDETLWRLHREAVDQARADRAASIDATIAAIRELSGR
jgi:hypothetical protein